MVNNRKTLQVYLWEGGRGAGMDRQEPLSSVPDAIGAF